MGGNAQGEKKKGLRASGVLCTGVTMAASGVAGEMGFRFRAFSALRAHLFACAPQHSPHCNAKHHERTSKTMTVALHGSDASDMCPRAICS